MTSRKKRGRQKSRSRNNENKQAATANNAMGVDESEDGILVQIREEKFSIAGEEAGQIQRLPGYKISIAVPGWPKNTKMLNDIAKGYTTQQKMITRLQTPGTDRNWMMERFDEIDKAIAKSLREIAERISTRRRRGDESLESLKKTFDEIQACARKTIRYCENLDKATESDEKEMRLDAVCMSIIRVGEQINKVERIQHGFWEEFSAAHFLKIKGMRNKLAHAYDLEEEKIREMGSRDMGELEAAIRNTSFPMGEGPNRGMFLVSLEEIRNLPASRGGERAGPENSAAMIQMNENKRFVIRRVGRSEKNKMLFTSSITEQMSVQVFSFKK